MSNKNQILENSISAALLASALARSKYLFFIYSGQRHIFFPYTLCIKIWSLLTEAAAVAAGQRGCLLFIRSTIPILFSPWQPSSRDEKSERGGRDGSRRHCNCLFFPNLFYLFRVTFFSCSWQTQLYSGQQINSEFPPPLFFGFRIEFLLNYQSTFLLLLLLFIWQKNGYTNRSCICVLFRHSNAPRHLFLFPPTR